MAASLPVRLRVLVPAVENAVGGDAFRPLDILSTRKGITVEVGNTDAEGRLVMGDALTAALEDKPDLLIDFSTLTGAARVAVGAEIAAFFTPDEGLAGDLAGAGARLDDPVWRLPLHRPYRSMLNSKAADISSTGSGPYGRCDHRGPLPAGIHRARRALGPFRHHGLEPTIPTPAGPRAERRWGCAPLST